MRLLKSMLKILSRATCFAVMLLLGVAAFNLFYLPKKMQMLRVADEFHTALIDNDKKTIDRFLTDDFTETGARHFVQTPEFIYKRDVLRRDYSQVKFTIRTKYLLPANIFYSRSDTLSFVKEINLLSEESKPLPPIIFIVSYTFEDSAEGMKISHIERHF